MLNAARFHCPLSQPFVTNPPTPLFGHFNMGRKWRAWHPPSLRRFYMYSPLRPVHVLSLCRASDKKAIFQNCHKLKNFHQKMSVFDDLFEAERRLRKLIWKCKAEHNTCNLRNRQYLHPHSSNRRDDETCKQVVKSARAYPREKIRHDKMQHSSQDDDWLCNQCSEQNLSPADEQNRHIPLPKKNSQPKQYHHMKQTSSKIKSQQGKAMWQRKSWLKPYPSNRHLQHSLPYFIKKKFCMIASFLLFTYVSVVTPSLKKSNVILPILTYLF